MGEQVSSPTNALSRGNPMPKGMYRRLFTRGRPRDRRTVIEDSTFAAHEEQPRLQPGNRSSISPMHVSCVPPDRCGAREGTPWSGGYMRDPASGTTLAAGRRTALRRAP
jgi:hypothetical protein